VLGVCTRFLLSREVWVDGFNLCLLVDISQVEGLGVGGWGYAPNFLLSRKVRVNGFDLC
jgi:hypothetical protein